MATKKKSFDAVAASRRWRIRTGRKLRGLSFAQQQELLRRTTETFLPPSRRVVPLRIAETCRHAHNDDRGKPTG
jgi:hypothetical protein